MRLGRGVIAAGLAAVLLATSVVGVAADNPRGVTVMTQNIYQGTELEHVLAATTSQQFVQGVATDYSNVIATNFPARADAMATEIARTGPTLVGLQEVATWQAQLPLPSYDFLQILIDALRAHGMQFAVVAVRDNFSAGGPGLFQSGLLNVQLTERTAIIARTDLPTSQLSVADPHAGAYQHVSVFQLLNGPFPLNAGWVSVDAKVRGKTIRFITTHLDGFNTAIAGAQAQELLAGPAATGLPVVISGDFNSEATDPAYTVVTGAGFSDAWRSTNDGQPGLTCCQVPPDSIVNPVSQLKTRIDYLFVRGLAASELQVVGANPSDRTVGGLWPSDHAGLVGRLEIGPDRDGDR